METTYQTTAREIRGVAKRALGEEVPQQQAGRLKRHLNEETHDDYLESYRLIPAYIEALMEANPHGVYVDVVYHPTGWLQRVFICPRQSDKIFRDSLRFVALDGTFTKNSFKGQHLLIACGRDGDNNTVIYAWALA
jgi:hypothetical protein